MFLCVVVEFLFQNSLLCAAFKIDSFQGFSINFIVIKRKERSFNQVTIKLKENFKVDLKYLNEWTSSDSLVKRMPSSIVLF